MQIRETHVLIDEYAVARQMARIVTGAGASSQDFVNPFSQMAGLSRGRASGSTNTSYELELSGDHKFRSGDDYVEVGDTGVRMKVADLVLAREDSEAILDGRRYYTGSFYEKAHLTIEGTDGADKISLAQDEKGNTIVEVSKGGILTSINAGSIARVSFRLGDAKDVLSIKADNYFGGIDIEGGKGDDRIDADVSYALKAGIAVSGGEGDDLISVKGRYSALQVEGGEGDDWIDANGWEYSPLLKYLSGGEGADLIFGGTGGEIDAGSGADLISMRDGTADLHGGGGDDVIYGGKDADRIYGEGGSDIIAAGAGDDFVNGGAGNDLVMGGTGSDWLNGGSGDDLLYGGGFMGQKLPQSQAGVVEVPHGYEFLTGGEGADSFWPSSVGPGHETAYTGEGAAVLDYDAEVDIIA